jgi:hypothetical protein
MTKEAIDLIAFLQDAGPSRIVTAGNVSRGVRYSCWIPRAQVAGITPAFFMSGVNDVVGNVSTSNETRDGCRAWDPEGCLG